MKIKNSSLLSGLSGTYGDYVICQTKDGPVMKKKPYYSKSKYATDPAYKKVRANNAEFSTAGRAVKLIREAFSYQLKYAKDSKLTPRMQALMMQVVKSDPDNIYGSRTAASGNFGFLDQFECNAHAGLGRIIAAGHTINIDRASGSVMIEIPSLKPKNQILYPRNAGSYRIICAVSEINFNDNTYSTNKTDSGLLPINNKATGPIVLATAIKPGSILPVFVAMGIQFVEILNGLEFPVEAGEFNPLCFVKIERP